MKRLFLVTIVVYLLTAMSMNAQEHKGVTFSGHQDKVHAVAYLSESQVATASFDRTIKIWDAASGKEERTLEGHTEMILTLAASPTGNRIASAGKDNVIKLWDLDSSDPPKELSGHRGAVYHVTFSPDGKLLASCGEDDTRIFIWDVEQAKSIKQLTAQDPEDKNKRRSLFCVDFSSDGKQLVSCGADRTVRLWDVQSGKEVRRLEGADYSVFKENGKKIERTIKKGGSHLAIYTVAFSPDNKLIAAGGLDKTIRIWDAASGQIKQTITSHSDFIYDLQFNQKSDRLLSCGHRGHIYLWDTTNGNQLSSTTTPSAAFSACLSPDELSVAAACADKNAYIVKLKKDNR